MSLTDEGWSTAEREEIARLNDELASLAGEAAEAEKFIMQLAAALFPEKPPSLRQLTWPETRGPAPAVPEVGTRAEDKLRAAEVRYRTLVEQIPAVTFMAVLGEGQNEIYVSPHIEALLGFTQEEWLDNPFLWYSQLHPDDRAMWNEEFACGCRTGGPFRAECRFMARDGRVVWVRGEARVVRDDVGRPLFLQGVAFDITDTKRAEALLLREAVRTTEEQYRDLVQGLGAVVWEARPAVFEFTFVSRHAEALLGFAPARWIEEPGFWAARIHPDDLDEVIGVWRMAMAEGEHHQLEYRVTAADGREVWLHDTLRVQRGPDGAAQSILGVMLDITVRKDAEEERARLLTREREARAEVETLNRIERLLAAELDFGRLVQTITDAGTELSGAQFGAFFSNVVGDSGAAYQLYALSGASREAFADFPVPRNTPLFDATFRGTANVRCEDVTRDPRYGTMAPHHGLPPGHLPVRSYLAVPVVSRSGEALGGLFFGHADPARFTERHERMLAGLAAQAAVALDNARLYEAAERARQDAEVANRAKDEFLGTMSHELRTPLTSVLGWTRMLRTGALNAASQARALETIERNAQSLAQLVEDILDVSRITSGKFTLDVQRTDLRSVIDAALSVVQLAAHAKGIFIDVSVTDRAAVMGDAQRLQQVVWNLLSNAIKFTPAGGHVAVRLETSGTAARIVVSDTGAGIPPEFLPHVFDRFRQADPSSTRAHGGLGLGLAIVRHIVELHGGTVHAESPGAGHGATFTVAIPRTLAPAVPDDAQDAPPRRSALAGARVLVIDDEPDARELISVVLESSGAQVVAVESGRAAIEAVGAMTPDIVISDIAMPEQDGYATLRELRRRGLTVPAIAVTAYGAAEDRRRSVGAGFAAHITKPIDPGALVDAVRVLRGAQPDAQAFTP